MDLDYYKILGVNENADSEAVREAYKELAKKHHPDKNDGTPLSEEIFKKVNEAYSTLSDPLLRKQYDAVRERQNTAANTPAPKKRTQTQKASYDFKGNTRYTIIAAAMVLVIAIGALLAYPHLNQWASNDQLKQARASAANEDWAVAMVYTSAAIEQWEDNGSAYLLRAQIQASIYQQYRSALLDFNMAFSLLPSDSILAEHYYMRAKCHHENGQLEATCKDLKSSFEKGFERAQQDWEVLCK